MATNAIFDILRRRRSPAKSQRKVVRKDPLPCQRSQNNWVVCLEIPIRANLFHGKVEKNWDQITPSTYPRARDTTSKFGKERVHREE